MFTIHQCCRHVHEKELFFNFFGDSKKKKAPQIPYSPSKGMRNSKYFNAGLHFMCATRRWCMYADVFTFAYVHTTPSPC